MLGTKIRQSQLESLAPNNIGQEIKERAKQKKRKAKLAGKVSKALRDQRKEQSSRKTKKNLTEEVRFELSLKNIQNFYVYNWEQVFQPVKLGVKLLEMGSLKDVQGRTRSLID